MTARLNEKASRASSSKWYDLKPGLQALWVLPHLSPDCRHDNDGQNCSLNFWPVIQVQLSKPFFWVLGCRQSWARALFQFLAWIDLIFLVTLIKRFNIFSSISVPRQNGSITLSASFKSVSSWSTHPIKVMGFWVLWFAWRMGRTAPLSAGSNKLIYVPKPKLLSVCFGFSSPIIQVQAIRIIKTAPMWLLANVPALSLESFPEPQAYNDSKIHMATQTFGDVSYSLWRPVSLSHSIFRVNPQK